MSDSETRWSIPGTQNVLVHGTFQALVYEYALVAAVEHPAILQHIHRTSSPADVKVIKTTLDINAQAITSAQLEAQGMFLPNY